MRDPGFDYIDNRSSFFQPKTPFAALKAAEEGLLPAEAYIYMATSVEAIADNPEHLEEIERILGQRNRDLKTNLLLIEVLGKLIKNKDKEIALFAAESINAIENDYNRKIEALPEDEYREKARTYSEMAVLNKSVHDLQNFYLREAFSNFRQLERLHELTVDDSLAMSQILIDLDLLTQARKIITDKQLHTPEALFILADIAFRQRDYSELFKIISRLNELRSILDSDQTIIIDFWMEKE
ncbi:MAG: hypothetical protein JEZ04_05870 [Spirochaetales bacterium]|nr:hypothetical protein [Spirochaetales bacterium]